MPQDNSSQLGDDEVDEQELIAEQLAAFKASRAVALERAKLHPVLEAARTGATEQVCEWW
jgi:hypothetical protein